MKYFVYIPAIILSLASCTDIVDIELNSGLQRLVVEANITDQNNPATVYLSRTTDYFNPNEPEKVSGAKISLESTSGRKAFMLEISEGKYQSSYFNGGYGENYILRIEDGDEMYEASSFLPQKVFIDSLEVAWFDSFNPNDSLGGGYILNCWYTDPADQTNFYMFTAEKINESKESEPEFRGSNAHILMSDALLNGKSSLINLNRRGLYEAGDTIKVELISIDQSTYTYLDQLGEVRGGGPGFGNSAPANPENNISNGAVGYFSAQAIDAKVIVVK